MLNRITSAPSLGLSALLILFPLTLSAASITYELDDVTLQGGQTVTGSFLYDTSTSAIIAASVTAPADLSVGNIEETFDNPNSSLPGGVLLFPDHDQILIGNALGDGIILTLVNTNLGTDNTIALDLVFPYESYVYEGNSGHAYDFIQSGSIVATPEPSFFFPSSLVLGVGYVARRRLQCSPTRK